MKIPKKLKIGGHVYQIKFPYRFQERLDLVGQHDRSLKELRITDCDECGNQRALSDIFVTLIHEIFHAFDENFGHKIFVGEEGEKRIVALSECTFAFLIDNDYLNLEENIVAPKLKK